MAFPKNPIFNEQDYAIYQIALLRGDLLTVRQAAEFVGISYSAFNYHLHRQHVKALTPRNGWNRFVTRQEAERFAERLRKWKDLEQHGSTFGCETPPDPSKQLFSYDDLLTAHQAAKLVGIKVGTFNYHLRAGHIAFLLAPDGRTHFVTKVEAERFAERLQKRRHERGFWSNNAWGEDGAEP